MNIANIPWACLDRYALYISLDAILWNLLKQLNKSFFFLLHIEYIIQVWYNCWYYWLRIYGCKKYGAKTTIFSSRYVLNVKHLPTKKLIQMLLNLPKFLLTRLNSPTSAIGKSWVETLSQWTIVVFPFYSTNVQYIILRLKPEVWLYLKLHDREIVSHLNILMT